MRLLPRYLLRGFLPSFAMAAVVMTSVLMMGYFIRLFNLAILKGIPMTWILRCFSLLLPYLLSLSLPMAYLVGLMLCLGHLSEDGELLALRASGFGYREVLAPFFVVSLALCASLLALNHRVSPDGLRSFKNRFSAALAQVSELDPEPRAFMELGDWKLFAEDVDKSRAALRGVRLFRQGPNALQVSARGGRYSVKRGEGITLELEDGELSRANPKDPARAMVAQFRRYRVLIPTGAQAAMRRSPDIQERNTPELRRMLASGALADRDVRETRTEIALRSAIAVSPFVFFWIGCPLGMRFEKRGRARGFTASLMILFGYYGLTMLGMGLGRRYDALAGAPWGADLACLTAGVVLVRRRLAR